MLFPVFILLLAFFSLIYSLVCTVYYNIASSRTPIFKYYDNNDYVQFEEKTIRKRNE